MKIKLINTGCFILMIIMNVLANALPLGGKNTGELSELYPNLFVPAGFTFSIWGLIYLLLFGFVIWQWKGRSQETLDKIGRWFAINSLANSSWIIAWHFQQVWVSLIMMFILLYSLIKIYTNLNIKYNSINWFRNVPFSVYLGWISVATIANITTLLVNHGLANLQPGAVFWTTAMVSVAGLLGHYFLWTRKDIFFSSVIVWACYGIHSKRVLDLSIDDYYIEKTAIAIALVLGLQVIYQVINFLRKHSF